MSARSSIRPINCISIAIIVLVASFVAMMPFDGVAVADGIEDFTYTLENGNTTVKITGYIGDGGAVEIPDSIEGLPVRSIEASAFAGDESITSVFIPKNVTWMSACPFSGCSNLTEITVDPNNTNFESVDGVLFDDDIERLIQFPSGKQGDYTVPDNVYSIGYKAFAYSAVSSVIMPDSVTTIDKNAFYHAETMTSMTLGNALSNLGTNAFSYCYLLESIDIPDSLGSIPMFAFTSCRSVTSLHIGSGVTTIDYSAFSFLGSITTLTVPDSVTSIGNNAFWTCKNLTSLNLGSGLTTIGSSAFSSCRGLTTVTIPDNVNSIGDFAFALCTNMTTIEVSVANAHFESIDGNLYDEAISKLIQHPCGIAGDFIVPDSVTTIGSGAMVQCPYLTSVLLPDSVSSIAELAISYGPLLMYINVTSGNSVYSSIDGVLMNKDGSTLIQYPSGRSGEYVIPDNVTALKEWSFSGATLLTSVTIPEGVTVIGEGTFCDCVLLTSVHIPDSVVTIGEWAFDECLSLIEIVVVEENEHFRSVDGVLFNKNMTEILVFPSSKGGEFTLPDDISTLSSYLFDDCLLLTSVVIPASVTTIEYNAFVNLPMLISIKFEGDAPECDSNWVNLYNSSLVIYYYLASSGFSSPTWFGIHTIGLGVATAPSLTSVDPSLNNITLTWTEPEYDGNTTITGYKVFYGTTLPDTQFGGVLPASARTVTVTGLTAETNYTFAIKAVNEYGDSPLSNIIESGTLSDDGANQTTLLVVVIVVVAIVAVTAAFMIWRMKRKG